MPGQTTAIPSPDGQRFTGYLSLPEKGSGPGLVLLQEIFGVNRVMRDEAGKRAPHVLYIDQYDLLKGPNGGYTNARNCSMSVSQPSTVFAPGANPDIPMEYPVSIECQMKADMTVSAWPHSVLPLALGSRRN